MSNREPALPVGSARGRICRQAAEGLVMQRPPFRAVSRSSARCDRVDESSRRPGGGITAAYGTDPANLAASVDRSIELQRHDAHVDACESRDLVRTTHAAIDRLIAELQRQEEKLLRDRGIGRTGRSARGPRYRMVIDGPFIETKEFGTSGRREP